MAQPAISALQAMVVPGVLITSAAIIASGLQTMYGAVNDRMRLMAAERMAALRGPDGALMRVGEVPSWHGERLRQLDAELPLLLHRHGLLRLALLLDYTGVLVTVASMILIAVAVTYDVNAAGDAALVVALAGTGFLLGSLAIAARSVQLSHDAIDFEVAEVQRLE